jgi:hypothetical protein
VEGIARYGPDLPPVSSSVTPRAVHAVGSQNQTAPKKRANVDLTPAPWELSQLSATRNKAWYHDDSLVDGPDDDLTYTYFYDDSDLSDQYIYILENAADFTLAVSPHNLVQGRC